jgi:hypothetical protein
MTLKLQALLNNNGLKNNLFIYVKYKLTLIWEQWPHYFEIYGELLELRVRRGFPKYLFWAYHVKGLS